MSSPTAAIGKRFSREDLLVLSPQSNKGDPGADRYNIEHVDDFPHDEREIDDEMRDKDSMKEPLLMDSPATYNSKVIKALQASLSNGTTMTDEASTRSFSSNESTDSSDSEDSGHASSNDDEYHDIEDDHGDLSLPSKSNSADGLAADSLVSAAARKADEDYQSKRERRLRQLHAKACKYLKAGKLNEAQKGFEEVLSILVHEFGDKHRRVASALHNLGIVHVRMGNFEEAQDVIEETIKIRKKAVGQFHPRVADSLVELGVILLSQEEFEDSIEIFNEALALREREATTLESDEVGKVQIQMAKILNNIGCAYYEYGEVDDAKEAFEDALAIQRERFKEGNFTSMPGFLATSITLCNLGYTFIQKAEWESAMFQLEEALKLQQNMLEPSDKTLANTLENHAFACTKFGAYDKALKQYSNIYSIDQQVKLHKSDIETSDILKKIAYCQIKLFHFEEGIKTLEKAKDIMQDHLLPDDAKIEEMTELLEALHYQLFKFPSLTEYISKTITSKGYRDPWNSDLLCKCGYDIDQEDIDLSCCSPKNPGTQTKLSGHKISFA